MGYQQETACLGVDRDKQVWGLPQVIWIGICMFNQIHLLCACALEYGMDEAG